MKRYQTPYIYSFVNGRLAELKREKGVSEDMISSFSNLPFTKYI